MNSKILKWKGDIERIVSDVTDTVENQYVFRRLGDIVIKNKEVNKDNLFWDYLIANFGAGLVLGVFRQVDERTEVVSLLKLLNEIKENSKEITLDWFASQYEPILPRQIGEEHFKEKFGSGDVLDASIVDQDIKNLKSGTAKVEIFRHTRIAHKNANKNLVANLSFNDVEAALKIIEKLTIKYHQLLNQSSYNELMPVISYDWEEIFRIPWSGTPR